MTGKLSKVNAENVEGEDQLGDLKQPTLVTAPDQVTEPNERRSTHQKRSVFNPNESIEGVDEFSDSEDEEAEKRRQRKEFAGKNRKDKARLLRDLEIQRQVELQMAYKMERQQLRNDARMAQQKLGEKNRIDAFIYYDDTVVPLLKEFDPLNKISASKLGLPTKQYAYLVMSKKSKHLPQVETISEQLKALIDEGKIKQLFKRYGL